MTLVRWLPVVAVSFLTFELHRYAPGATFLALAAAALWFGHWPAVRKCFLVFLFTSMILASQVYGQRWPFESWSLYRTAIPGETAYYVLSVGDDRGRYERFDDRALGELSTPTNLTRLAGRMVAREGSPEFDETARFLLAQGNRYRTFLLAGGPIHRLAWLRFPSHQYASAWSAPQLAAMGEFTRVRISRVDVSFSPDGRAVESLDEQVIVAYAP